MFPWFLQTHAFSTEMMARMKRRDTAQKTKYKFYELEKELAKANKKLPWANEYRRNLVQQLFKIKVEIWVVQEKRDQLATESHGSTRKSS